jgi:hypothetical protein
MATFRVTFDRIGRSRDVEPMTFENVSDPDELAALVYERARRHLASRGVEVHVDLDEMTGHIYTGFHPAGSFTIEEA